jgi:amidase
MAAVDVLAKAGAKVAEVSIPEHTQVRKAQNALGEGPLSLFKTGFFGAFARTYYPASIIAPINELWASHADVLAPRTKLSLIAAEIARKNYRGRLYAKAQNVRPTFIKAFDTALRDYDVLVMPTCLTTAPKDHRPGSYLEAVEDNLTAIARSASQNTQPLNYTGHPALAMPVGKSSAGLPASMQIVGRFFDDPLVLRVAYAYQHAVDWDAMIAVAS